MVVQSWFTVGAVVSAVAGVARWMMQPELTEMQAFFEFWPYWLAVLVFAACRVLTSKNERS